MGRFWKINHPHGLKAFTILELLVVLSLGAIVTGIAYGAFTIINKQYLSQGRINARNQTISLLNRLMVRDFGKSERIIRTDYGVACLNPNGSKIFYVFKDGKVFREGQNRLDTFAFDHLTATYYFTNSEVMVRDMVVDQVTLDCEVNGESIFIGADKVYGADIWMEGK